MAGELQFSFAAGRTCYFQVRNRVAQIWSTSGAGAFESYLAANVASYAISATEQGTVSAYYAGTFPSAITPGVYAITAKQQLGGSVAEADPTVAVGDYQWNGSVTLPLSDLTTSGQLSLVAPIKLARGVMVQNFPFKLVSSLDHVTPFVSGVVSGQISRNGGQFGALQSGTFTEVGLGWYALGAFTSGDLLANSVAVVFTANGISGGQADPRDFSMILQRSSGQA